MSRAGPLRFLLVRPRGPGTGCVGQRGRWSVDRLFLDQDSIPTQVEVKRSTDSRLRRESVGQLLDYAANGVRHWAAGELRKSFERRCAAASQDPATRGKL